MAKFGNDLLRLSPKDADTHFDIVGVGDFSVLENSQLSRPQSGGPYGLPATITNQAPTFPFSTEDLETVVSNITALNGLCIETGATYDGLSAWQGRRDSCVADGRAAGTAQQFTAAKGHVLVESVNAADTGSATVQLTAHALSADGEADAIAQVFNGTIPTVAPSETIWKLAGVMINNVFIKACSNVSIALNHSFAKPVEGNVVAAEFDWQQAVPVVSMTITDPERVFGSGGNLALTRKGLRINSSVASPISYIQFRKSDDTEGGMEEPTSSVHLRCHLNGLVHATNRSQASGVASATTQLELASAKNAVGNPLIWETGVPITT